MGSLVLLAVAGLVVLAAILVAGGIAGNRLPLAEPPGFAARIGTYLGSNVARTDATSDFPELKPVWLEGDPATLLESVGQVCRDLGWQPVTTDAAAATVSAVVTSRVFGFRDDVVVTLVPGNERVEARIVSSSRVGRGDLGANARHVIDLRQALRDAGMLEETSAR